MVVTFMEILRFEDEYDYVFDVLLESLDNTSRMYVGQLMKFLLNKLKIVEKDILTQTKKVTVTSEKGETTE
jgi:hypothetical protein